MGHGRRYRRRTPLGIAGHVLGAVAVVGLTVVAISTGVGAFSEAGAGSGTPWAVYHGDLLGSGVASGSTTFHGATAAWTSRRLHGQIFGEPLVVGNDVIVATENDYVYALSATGGGKVLWSTRVGTPVPARRLPCGDIKPDVGITSTPVIDTTRNEVFVVADEWSRRHHSIGHHLVGLNASTGAVLLNQVVDPPGTTPAAQLQRDALTLDDGQVVMAMGGNDGDCSTYHGWVVAAPETGGTLRTFEVDPARGDLQGAVWMGGAAPVVDASGHIWFATGNGAVDTGPSPDYSDSVIELSSSLAPLQTFTPSTWPTDNDSDYDLGSSDPALLPDGLVLQAGKSDTAYLLDGSDLGGVGGQLTEMTSFCGADVDGGNAVDGTVVYMPCGNGVTAVQVGSSPPSLSVLWTTSTGSAGPAIVADGLVWTIDRGGNLYGLDPATGDAVTHFSIGAVSNHFPTPSVGDGMLFAPASQKVSAYTLTP